MYELGKYLKLILKTKFFIKKFSLNFYFSNKTYKNNK